MIGSNKDIRFAEMAAIYQKRNCCMIYYPGAFNLTTGPAHWELLGNTRYSNYNYWQVKLEKRST